MQWLAFAEQNEYGTGHVEFLKQDKRRQIKMWWS